MMMSEFTSRTNYEPSFEEYRFIEDSYYEFPGNKDEFCKAWMKDKKSGAWEKELTFRKQLESQKKEYEAKIAEQDDTIKWYAEQHEKLTAKGMMVIIKCKGEQSRMHNDVTVNYIDNGTIKFYSIKEIILL